MLLLAQERRLLNRLDDSSGFFMLDRKLVSPRMGYRYGMAVQA
jgi:hypothetical protein